MYIPTLIYYIHTIRIITQGKSAICIFSGILRRGTRYITMRWCNTNAMFAVKSNVFLKMLSVTCPLKPMFLLVSFENWTWLDGTKRCYLRCCFACIFDKKTANIGFAFQHHVTPGRTKSGKSSIRMKTILKLRFCWHAGTQQRHPHEILWHSRCWDKPPDKTAEIWKTQNRLVWTNMVTFHLQKLQGMPGMPPEFSFLYGFHACPVDQSAGLAGVSSEMGLDDGLLVCTLLLLI